MTTASDVLKKLIAEADDDASHTTRQELCSALAGGLAALADALWVGGYILGGDRVDGQSPFGFGDDGAVGVATLAQIAAALVRGATSLLDQNNAYAAAALLRQLVEVEYLAWAFAEDHEEAASWLRSSTEERQRMWQPRHLRTRAQGRFRATDYAEHCDLGGHPTPASMLILQSHSASLPLIFWWLDLTGHTASIWEYIDAASKRLDYGSVVTAVAETHHIETLMQQWRDADRLWPLVTLTSGAGTTTGEHSRISDRMVPEIAALNSALASDLQSGGSEPTETIARLAELARTMGIDAAEPKEAVRRLADALGFTHLPPEVQDVLRTEGRTAGP